MAEGMLTLEAQVRDTTGSRQAQKLRAGAKIPGIIYGRKEPAVMVTLDKRQVLAALAHHTRIVECKLPDAVQTCLLKDVQYDYLGSEPIHVDLTRVSLTDRIRLTVPIQLKGTPKGAKEGGVLTQLISDLEIECLASAIPDSIKLSVEQLDVNQFRFVKDLILPQGVTTERSPEDIVCQLKTVLESELVPTTPVEPGAEPEVQTKGKKEEEGAEGAEGAAGAKAEKAKKE